MEFEYQLDRQTRKFIAEIAKDSCSAEIEGEKFHFDFSFLGENILNLTNETGNHPVYFAQDKEGIYVFVGGEKFFFKSTANISKFAGAGSAFGPAKGLVTTPMPGTIIKILVKEGDLVEKDQGLVIVEAMKMENEIRSTFKAKVKKINFQPGDPVDVGKSIIDLEEITEIPNS
jgi:biotin carboxyl carrier protein